MKIKEHHREERVQLQNMTYNFQTSSLTWQLVVKYILNSDNIE